MITQGIVITLEDNKEYICIQNIVRGDENYLYLISNFKPLEVRFAKQMVNSNDFTLEIINNYEEKIQLLELFQQVNSQNNER